MEFFYLQGRDQRRILVLNVYNVCQDRATGPNTLYSQQVVMYCLVGITEPRPHQLFADNFRKLLLKATQEHNNIIVVGEFNESIGDPLEKLPAIAKVITEVGLIDVHTLLH